MRIAAFDVVQDEFAGLESEIFPLTRACVAHRCLLEINGHPERMDLPDTLAALINELETAALPGDARTTHLRAVSASLSRFRGFIF